MSLPGADELFRATASAGRSPDGGSNELGASGEQQTGAPGVVRLAPVRATTPVRTAGRGRRPAGGPSGREKHDEKITVYVSPEELLALEHARLDLRAVHGLAVDRGRIVREAVAVVLADLEAKGADSIIVRRLRD
ncbi:MAG TPA: cobyrinic acid a,c-diamide synthase [Mycobacteriales bacterium]|nr:cobyrinic acid a,c-diamide synthase [Mycobacteriales bacterium]